MTALAFAFPFVQGKARCSSIVVLRVLTVSYTILHEAHRKDQKQRDIVGAAFAQRTVRDGVESHDTRIAKLVKI